MADVVPALLDRIEKEFDRRFAKSKEAGRLLSAMADGRATQPMIHDYSLVAGRVLRDSLETVLTADTLPDGVLYYNIADRTVKPMLRQNHNMILAYADDVQKTIYAKHGTGVGVLNPAFNENRAAGLIDKMGGLPIGDALTWFDEPLINFCENVVDDWTHENAAALYSAGYSPKIIRTLGASERRTSGGKYPQIYFIPCDWCAALAGEYDYNSVKNTGNDVYRRHVGCRCDITYVEGERVDNVVTHTPVSDPAEIARRLNYNTEIFRR